MTNYTTSYVLGMVNQAFTGDSQVMMYGIPDVHPGPIYPPYTPPTPEDPKDTIRLIKEMLQPETSLEQVIFGLQERALADAQKGALTVNQFLKVMQYTFELLQLVKKEEVP